jgi:GxxExxY protein
MEEYCSDNDWTGMIVDAAIEVHRTLGPGLLESVYEEALAYELHTRGLGVVRQVPLPVRYKEVKFEMGFRADLLVQGRIIVELKSVEKLAPVHKKQPHRRPGPDLHPARSPQRRPVTQLRRRAAERWDRSSRQWCHRPPGRRDAQAPAF